MGDPAATPPSPPAKDVTVQVATTPEDQIKEKEHDKSEANGKSSHAPPSSSSSDVQKKEDQKPPKADDEMVNYIKHFYLRDVAEEVVNFVEHILPDNDEKLDLTLVAQFTWDFNHIFHLFLVQFFQKYGINMRDHFMPFEFWERMKATAKKREEDAAKEREEQQKNAPVLNELQKAKMMLTMQLHQKEMADAKKANEREQERAKEMMRQRLREKLEKQKAEEVANKK